MTKKVVFAVALALVVVGIAAPSASAACNPPKFASTYNSGTGAFAYWHTTLPVAGAALVGQMWSGSTDYTGTCNSGGHFLYFGATPGDVGLNVSLGDACVPGCPAGDLAVKATVIAAGGASQQFVAVSRSETPLNAVNFDYSGTAHTMVAEPTARPRILSSSRAGTTISLQVATDPYSASNGWFDGTGSSIMGWNIMSTAGVADPGRLASAYTQRSFIPAAGGVAGPSTLVDVDCSDITKDQWVVAALVNSAGSSLTVGPASRVKCNPALAQPNYKFVVPSKKTERPFGNRN